MARKSKVEVMREAQFGMVDILCDQIPDWADRVRFTWYYENSTAVDKALREKTKAERAQENQLPLFEETAVEVIAAPGGTFVLSLFERIEKQDE